MAWLRVPADEVEVRRRSRVVTSDFFAIGRVEGFVTDEDRNITHLFGHRDLVVPVDAIKRVANDRVTLAITRREVRDLPRARVCSWWDHHRVRPPNIPCKAADHDDGRVREDVTDGLIAEHPHDPGIDEHEASGPPATTRPSE